MSSNTPSTTLCTFQFLALKGALPRFLSTLSSSSPPPLVTAKVARWIVPPTKLSPTLLTQDPPWDILLKRGCANQDGKGAVSMINLLAYNKGEKDVYMEYVKAFGETVGARRGSVAKMIGQVRESSSSSSATEGGREWDDVAIVHYPSILHFGDLLASKEYRDLDHRYKVGTLEDTCILCVTELDLSAENAAKVGR
ncbi:MAG: hypothetical protein M1830_002756 [Pleopsidium flavum]|nr:MAG: hypothetical protein M1830_002756 [Pleopsidium flavum]